MRIPQTLLLKIRLAVLIVFTGVCAWIFGFLWLNSGGTLPLISQEGYRVAASFPRVANLVQDSDVKMAGVDIGKVHDLDIDGDQVLATMDLDPEQAPLHQGATIQVRSKTLVEESYLEIVDGTGPAIPDGTVLPEGSGLGPTQLNDVLASLNPGTRQALAGTIRSLGGATRNTKEGVSGALAGLGALGREGNDAVAALAEQSKDLRELSGNAATLLAALDTRQGQIASLVHNADLLTEATASTSGEIESVLRELPPLLDSARSASGKITELSGSLAPVVADLNSAAPDLDRALRALPAAAADLRATLPALDASLGKAGATLDRVPPVAGDAAALVRTLDVAVADVNPILHYLRPYGPELASVFTNLGQSLAGHDVNGNALRVFPVFNEQTVRNMPLKTGIGPLRKSNAYPAPGSQVDPGSFEGNYPRVKKAPR